MRAKTPRMLEMVWEMKRLAQEETAHLKTAEEYFSYIHSHIPKLNLPVAPAPGAPRPARSAKRPAANRRAAAGHSARRRPAGQKAGK